MIEEWSDHSDSEMEILTRQTLPKLRKIDLWSCSLERDPKFLMKIHKMFPALNSLWIGDMSIKVVYICSTLVQLAVESRD